MSNNSAAVLQKLIESNVTALQDGLELIRLLDAQLFTRNCEPAFQSSIGVHYRHLLEHYICFLEQLPGGSISYDQRCRDMRLELDIHYTENTLLSLCVKLEQLDADRESTQLLVTDQPLSNAVESNMERELLFLLSHTTHHYAIIAALSRLLGITPKDGFGVAIATQTYLANTVTG